MSLFQFFSKTSNIHQQLQEFAEQEQAALVDVRTPAEYASGHIPKSINIPLDQIHTIQVPKQNTIYVYCHSGARSARAAGILRRAGYAVVDLGGILSYRGPIE